MRSLLIAAVGIALAGSAARAQVIPVRLSVTVADSGKPTVPVPHLILMIRGSTGESVPVVTDERGVARTSLPAGEYEVTSFAPYAWRGRHLEWSLVLGVRGDSAALDLTAANAGPMLASAESWPAIARGLGLGPGERVRVTTMRGERYTASVAFTHPDTIWLRASGGSVTVPSRSLAMLEVSRKSYEAGLMEGVLMGLVGGVLFGHAKTYLAGGALIGLLFPVESWQPVPILRP